MSSTVARQWDLFQTLSARALLFIPETEEMLGFGSGRIVAETLPSPSQSPRLNEVSLIRVALLRDIRQQIPLDPVSRGIILVVAHLLEMLLMF